MKIALRHRLLLRFCLFRGFEFEIRHGSFAATLPG